MVCNWRSIAASAARTKGKVNGFKGKSFQHQPISAAIENLHVLDLTGIYRDGHGSPCLGRLSTSRVTRPFLTILQPRCAIRGESHSVSEFLINRCVTFLWVRKRITHRFVLIPPVEFPNVHLGPIAIPISSHDHRIARNAVLQPLSLNEDGEI